jgi:hypothetical protein
MARHGIATGSQENLMSNQQKDTNAGAPSRSDTTSAAGAQPVQGRSDKTGADLAGRAGTDAAAGATMGGDGGHGLRGQEGVGAPQGDRVTPGTGAAIAGGTGLGEAASADDARTGTSSGEGAALTGGDPSSGKVPPPTNKGGASAA